MDLQTALTFRHSTVQQDIVCAVDAISDLCQTLDRLEVATAMLICGPTILRSADVVQRVQQALGDRCVGLFAGVLPHAPVEMLQEAVEVAAHSASRGAGQRRGWEQSRYGQGGGYPAGSGRAYP